MSILKEFIGDELDAQLDKALEGKEDKVKIGNLAAGQYVDKEKYGKLDREHAQLKKDKAAVDAELSGLKAKGMTDDEKVQAAIDAAAADKKQYGIALNKLEAEKIFTKAGLSEEDYSDLLDGLVSEDKDSTIAKVNSISALLSKQKAATEKAVKAELLKKTPGPEGGTGGKEPKAGDFGRELGKSAAQTAKSSSEAYESLLKI